MYSLLDSLCYIMLSNIIIFLCSNIRVSYRNVIILVWLLLVDTSADSMPGKPWALLFFFLCVSDSCEEVSEQKIEKLWELMETRISWTWSQNNTVQNLHYKLPLTDPLSLGLQQNSYNWHHLYFPGRWLCLVLFKNFLPQREHNKDKDIFSYYFSMCCDKIHSKHQRETPFS